MKKKEYLTPTMCLIAVETPLLGTSTPGAAPSASFMDDPTLDDGN